MTRPRYGPVEPLGAHHDVSSFDCGEAAETAWLRDHSLHAHRANTSRVHVVRRLIDDRVVGYHALAAGSVEPGHAPRRIVAGTGRHPVPVILITRLGVDLSEQGHGLGRALLADALRRILAASEQFGIRAVLIHCENDAARDFYMRQAEFDPSPTDPLHLMLLTKDLRRAFGR